MLQKFATYKYFNLQLKYVNILIFSLSFPLSLFCAYPERPTNQWCKIGDFSFNFTIPIVLALLTCNLKNNGDIEVLNNW